MRGVASYIIAGFLIGLALDVGAPIVFGYTPVAATPSAPNKATLQSVDRTYKGDRVPVMTVGKRQPEPSPNELSPKMMAGCDPAFSPLSASARANFARSCAA